MKFTLVVAALAFLATAPDHVAADIKAGEWFGLPTMATVKRAGAEPWKSERKYVAYYCFKGKWGQARKINSADLSLKFNGKDLKAEFAEAGSPSEEFNGRKEKAHLYLTDNQQTELRSLINARNCVVSILKLGSVADSERNTLDLFYKKRRISSQGGILTAPQKDFDFSSVSKNPIDSVKRWWYNPRTPTGWRHPLNSFKEKWHSRVVKKDKVYQKVEFFGVPTISDLYRYGTAPWVSKNEAAVYICFKGRRSVVEKIPAKELSLLMDSRPLEAEIQPSDSYDSAFQRRFHKNLRTIRNPDQKQKLEQYLIAGSCYSAVFTINDDIKIGENHKLKLVKEKGDNGFESVASQGDVVVAPTKDYKFAHKFRPANLVKALWHGRGRSAAQKAADEAEAAALKDRLDALEQLEKTSTDQTVIRAAAKALADTKAYYDAKTIDADSDVTVAAHASMAISNAVLNRALATELSTHVANSPHNAEFYSKVDDMFDSLAGQFALFNKF